ncbi:MAG: putative Oxidoreductase, aldo/keto reductase family protein [Armatimonadetes bacterium]|jgi:predicted aldo/keto reductase-like oxidoreductase|nr:putative Oxidoreductase, aldo/keto reductase family protein [Armatimonadota bacterium]
MERQVTRRELLKSAAAIAGAGVLGNEAQAAAPLPLRTLGKTGMRIPVLGFGTAPCGIRRSLANGIKLYHEALDAGITYFDTAPTNTGYGRAQEQLGHVLKERRKDIFLVTKCHEASGDAALRILQKNLKELKTGYADLVHIHSLGDLDVSTVMGKSGVYQALLKAKRDGLVRHIGVSGHHRPSRFLRLIREADLDVMMCAVNFADRHTYEFETRIWPAAAKKNIGLVAMKVFGGMRYDQKSMTNSMMPEKHLESAFRYALSLPAVSLAVIGMGTSEELQRNLAWARSFQPLSVEERQALVPVGKALAATWGAHFGPVA